MTALERVSGCHLVRGELRSAREIAEQHLAIAERVGNRGEQLNALLKIAWTLEYGGEFAAARKLSERINRLWAAPGSELAEYDSQGWLRALSAQLDPELLWYLGYPDQAGEKSRQALIAGEAAAPFYRAWALFHTGLMHTERRDFGAVREQVARLEMIADWLRLGPIFHHLFNPDVGRGADRGWTV